MTGQRQIALVGLVNEELRRRIETAGITMQSFRVASREGSAAA